MKSLDICILSVCCIIVMSDRGRTRQLQNINVIIFTFEYLHANVKEIDATHGTTAINVQRLDVGNTAQLCISFFRDVCRVDHLESTSIHCSRFTAR